MSERSSEDEKFCPGTAMRWGVRDQSAGDAVYYSQCKVHLSPSPAPRASGSQFLCSGKQQDGKKVCQSWPDGTSTVDCTKGMTLVSQTAFTAAGSMSITSSEKSTIIHWSNDSAQILLKKLQPWSVSPGKSTTIPILKRDQNKYHPDFVRKQFSCLKGIIGTISVIVRTAN